MAVRTDSALLAVCGAKRYLIKNWYKCKTIQLGFQIRHRSLFINTDVPHFKFLRSREQLMAFIVILHTQSLPLVLFTVSMS